MEGPRETVAALTAEVLVAAGRDCAASLTRKLGEIDSKEGEEQVDHLEKRDKGGISLLVHMFEQFREGLFDDVEFSRVGLTIRSVHFVKLMLENSNWTRR